MKSRAVSMLLILFMLLGLVLTLYPTVCNYWNSLHQTRFIAEYRESVSSAADSLDELKDAARSYNRSLLERTSPYSQTDEQAELYPSMLDTNGTGIMGYIKIPEISVELPIYHGVDRSVLQVGVGHIQWSSLPIGGRWTHCVLTAHRGLTTARLFTDLDKLVVGSRFTLCVLDEEATYEVFELLVVEPDETSSLTIRGGEELCTLVTCTPYGINTHRLLVCGRRVLDNAVEPTPEPVGINKLYIVGASILALSMLIYAARILAAVRGRRK